MKFTAARSTSQTGRFELIDNFEETMIHPAVDFSKFFTVPLTFNSDETIESTKTIAIPWRALYVLNCNFFGVKNQENAKSIVEELSKQFKNLECIEVGNFNRRITNFRSVSGKGM